MIEQIVDGLGTDQNRVELQNYELINIQAVEFLNVHHSMGLKQCRSCWFSFWAFCEELKKFQHRLNRVLHVSPQIVVCLSSRRGVFAAKPPGFYLMCSNMSCVLPPHQAAWIFFATQISFGEKPCTRHAWLIKNVFKNLNCVLMSAGCMLEWPTHPVLPYRVVRTDGCPVVVTQWTEHWQLKPKVLGLILRDCWL